MERRTVRLGLVADTHMTPASRGLPASLLAALSGVDRILHAGDLVSLSVLGELARIAPVVAVGGNCDPASVARVLLERALWTIHGCTVGIQHGHQPHALQDVYLGRGYDAPEFNVFCDTIAGQLRGADVIVFGHFHAPIVRRRGGLLFVSPGSVAPPHAAPTCALLEIQPDGTPAASIVDLGSSVCFAVPCE
ncbi:MAG: metallophosphoesterase family protein [Candidatus Bipolaricaulota bacterium]